MDFILGSAIFLAVVWIGISALDALSYADDARRWRWPSRWVLPHYRVSWKMNITIGLGLVVITVGSVLTRHSPLPTLVLAVAMFIGGEIYRRQLRTFTRLFHQE